jgi:hypothetical protein
MFLSLFLIQIHISISLLMHRQFGMAIDGNFLQNCGSERLRLGAVLLLLLPMGPLSSVLKLASADKTGPTLQRPQRDLTGPTCIKWSNSNSSAPQATVQSQSEPHNSDVPMTVRSHRRRHFSSRPERLSGTEPSVAHPSGKGKGDGDGGSF